ncbi:response regulator transcription factor [Bacteroides acidifaciens]|uniref:helix-turn-helix transcriptional regulator n=1 Tax=Bacteroides acidifaciens TaxID=85831 RepID=UPI00258FCE01|nr:response regulator transcription factor [Bacteroides acidifaciens]
MKFLVSSLFPDATVIETEQEADIASVLSSYPSALVIIDYTLSSLTEEKLLILSQRFPSSGFILFSEQLSKDFLKRMLFGSSRFHLILKDCKRDEIQEGLHVITSGRQFICNSIKDWLQHKESERTSESVLTATEKEILKSISLGLTNKEIASTRFLSVHTVMTHRKNIFRKLGVNNVQEAIRYALKAGIVDPIEYYI